MINIGVFKSQGEILVVITSRGLKFLLLICNAWRPRLLMCIKEFLVIVWLCKIKEKTKKKQNLFSFGHGLPSH